MTKKKKAATEFLKHWNKKLKPAVNRNENLLMRWDNFKWIKLIQEASMKVHCQREAVTQGKEREEIDWYCYQKVILEPKLILFVKECMMTCSDTVVQKNKASAYNLKHQKPVYALA
jgi:hypothetical protein